jgi:hypothetical protein
MDWASSTLGLLERGALWKLRGENQWAKHVPEFLNPELVFDGLRANPVNNQT